MTDKIYKISQLVLLAVIAVVLILQFNTLAAKKAGSVPDSNTQTIFNKLTETDIARLQRGLCVLDVQFTGDDFLSATNYSDLSEYEKEAREKRTKERSKACIEKYEVK